MINDKDDDEHNADAQSPAYLGLHAEKLRCTSYARQSFHIHVYAGECDDAVAYARGIQVT